MIDLRELRIKQGLTLKQVAEKAGVSEGYISHIERGKQSMPVHTAKRIAEVLGFDWTKFYE